jgi:hypothetical protein
MLRLLGLACVHMRTVALVWHSTGTEHVLVSKQRGQQIVLYVTPQQQKVQRQRQQQQQ